MGKLVIVLAALVVSAASASRACAADPPSAEPADATADGRGLQLLPYPQEVKLSGGGLLAGRPESKTVDAPSAVETVAEKSLQGYLPQTGQAMTIRLGSVEEGYDHRWLTPAEQTFLARPETSPEASILSIAPDGVTVVGKGKWGMLYGVQTVNQLAIQAARQHRAKLPCLVIRDWPDAKWRCLSPQLAWYSGWALQDAFDMGNWGLDEWKWLVDWSLLHKVNAWAVCMYGLWPFKLPGYEQDTMDYDSFRHDPLTDQKIAYRYIHPNIRREFWPELARYANARGIQVDAYIGKNTFNGVFIKRHPEADAHSLVAEAIPFTPGIHEYWDAFIKRILELGFNGFVFEDPEMNHVPNQNEGCYKTFWEPWAKQYGFKSVAGTNKNAPPLGVQVEYYTWLFREFDALIQKHGKELGRPTPEIYLISHILLKRIMQESKSDAERKQWFALIDQKQGRPVPFVLFEADEKQYVQLLGPGRAATLGGRGGAGAAYQPIANINHDHLFNADVSSDVGLERAKQRRMVEAGGLGGMAYVFKWTNAEVFGYLGAQYYWRHGGVPGINNEDDFGFLDYAYRLYYGDETGRLAAQAYSVNSCVNEWMVPDDARRGDWAHGSGLSREFRLLAPLADEADELARQAYRQFTGQEPDLLQAVYHDEDFHWDGYAPAADKRFKTERLRQLCVSTARSRALATAALAVRNAKQLAVDGASMSDVHGQLDAAAKAARTSEILYLSNFNDHYAYRGLAGTNLRQRLEQERDKFLANCRATEPKAALDRSVPEAVRKAFKRFCITHWEKQTDILPPASNGEKSGLFLSLDLGLSKQIDFFCVGMVFTVEARGDDGAWRTIFRRALLKKDAGWQHWEIPLQGRATPAGNLSLRFTTDAYSRAIDRTAPTWKWGYWGRPQIVLATADGKRDVRHDLIGELNHCRRLVQLDDTGQQRTFDNETSDSTGAVFRLATRSDDSPEPPLPAIAAFAPHGKADKFGVTIAEFQFTK